MDKELLEWIIDEMTETRLQDICKIANVKIPGFRSIRKYPKMLIVPNLLKNKNQLFEYLKQLADDSEENSEFQGKDIQEIESSIDIENKEKTIEQIIYLITRNTLEYTNLANKTINMIKNKYNKENDSTIDKEEKNKEIQNLIKNEKKDDNMIDSEKVNSKYIVTVKCENYNFWNIYPL
ncbi:hypothetical protein [Haloimpatiens massiliensis]|uniref:hypothetical protein n=1 Tax=Haloimpatiens massiliensis TaxID=1658110 RepID=UPI000C856F0E|nr:hypothetical protein [Haloimpatiens massiliensis]